MRTKLGVIALGCLCVPFFQCGGGDDSTSAQAGDAGTSDAKADASSSDAGDDSAPPFTVAATLLLSGNTTPLANRAVVILDASGVVTKLTTDANGKFGATGVHAPYDIAVPYELPDAGGTFLVPRYYVGISRPDPIVQSSSYALGPPPDITPRSATINVSLNVCNGCSYLFAGCSGESGNGGTGVAIPISYPCKWEGPTTHATAFHALITDSTGAYVSGADLPMQTFNSGDNVQLGTPTLVPITNEKITVNTTLPAGYTFVSGLELELIYADGITTGSPSLTSLTNVVNYPFVPNVFVQLTAAAQGSTADEDTNIIAKYPASGVPATLATNLLAAPKQLLPADTATAVSSTQSFTWAAYGASVVYQLTLFANKTDYAIYSSTPSFDLSKLSKVGMALQPATKYEWNVNAGGALTQTGKMDDFVVAPSTPSGAAIVENASNSLTRTFTTQ